MISTLLMFFFSTLAIVWSIPLAIGSLFGIQTYKIKNQQKAVLTMKKLPKNSTIIEDDNLRGWIWGQWYIGYVAETAAGQYGSASNVEIYIVTNKKFYETITTHEHKTEKEPEIINYYYRDGNYFHLSYEKRELDVSKYVPRENQKDVIKKIIDHYRKNNHTTVFLHGKAGSGKSLVSVLIAKEFKSSLCDTFNPTEPNDYMELIYNAVSPTIDSPLILVFEEADIMFCNIHYGKIILNKNIPTKIKDKIGMNMFLDKIDRGFFPNLILIMTSNKPPEFIDELDPSYIREGRIDLRIQLNQ